MNEPINREQIMTYLIELLLVVSRGKQSKSSVRFAVNGGETKRYNAFECESAVCFWK